MPPPAIKPLPGYTVLGRDGESYGYDFLVASGVTFGLAMLAVLLRTFSKIFVLGKVHVEDYLAIFALLLALARLIMYSLLVSNYQFGQHIWDYEIPNFDKAYMWGKGGTLIYLAAIICVKWSALIFYVRVFGVNRKFKFACYAMMGLVMAYAMALGLAIIFQCRPLIAGWSFFTKGACISLIKINIAIGGFNIATDFLIVVMPIYMVMKLQLSPARRIGLLAVLATGLLVVAMAIVRQVKVVNAPNSYDATWMNAQRETWLAVELNTGIFAICLPLLTPLGRRLPTMNSLRDRFDSVSNLLRGSLSKQRSTSTLDVNSLQKQKRDMSSIDSSISQDISKTTAHQDVTYVGHKYSPSRNQSMDRQYHHMV